MIYYFKHILTLQASFLPTAYTFAQHHRLISFGLYTIGKFSHGVFCVRSIEIHPRPPSPPRPAGFVSFVATLNRASLRRQFSLFGWIHMSLLLIVVSSHFIVNNILEVRTASFRLLHYWSPRPRN